MQKSRYSESQILAILKEAEAGVRVAELCRTHGMSEASAPLIFRASSSRYSEPAPIPSSYQMLKPCSRSQVISLKTADSSVRFSASLLDIVRSLDGDDQAG